MQWSSYPKETPAQCFLIARDLGLQGGACNQSINKGCSPRELHNLMTPLLLHTHTPPHTLTPPLPLYLISFFFSFYWIPFVFVSFFCHLPSAEPLISFCSLCGLRHSPGVTPPLTPAVLPSHPPLTSPKFQGDRVNKGEECRWPGVEVIGSILILK